MAYVEGNLDWMRETGLDITRELDRSNGCCENRPGTELAPTIEEYTALIQRPTPTTHGTFVPNPFTTVQSQLSTLLCIPSQDIHKELHQRWDQGIRIAWLSDWTLLRAMTPTTASYRRDACHGFLLLVFGTLLFPYSPNLIDGAIAQVVLQAVGGHNYVEALLAETVRSLDYVREVRRGRMRGSPHLLQIWLLAHIRPFCSSHPFSYIADERSLIERLDIPIEADRLPFGIQWADSTSTAPARFLQIREIRRQRDASIIQRLYFPEHPTDEERTFSATSAYVARFYARGLAPPQRSQAAPTPRATSTLAPEAESSIQAAMHAELRAVREERDRLRCELVDSRAERLRMAEGDHVDISEEVNPSVPTLSQPPPTHAPPPLTPAGVLPAYSSALPTHLPPPASSGAPLPLASLTSVATDDQARIAALESTVNQMATNMAELLALLRGPNRASSSSTPSPRPGPTVDPTPRAPPTQAPENVEAPAPPTLHTSTVHPFTTQLPPPPAPTAVPLPPATFLSSEHILSAPPPVSIPAPAMAYAVPPPMVFPASSAPAPTHLQAAEPPPYPSLQPHAGLSYQAPPPINTTFHEPSTPTHAAHLFPGMRLPPKFKIPEFKTYEGTTDPRHHLRHYRWKMLQYWEYEEFVIHSFQDSLSGSALDWFMSLKAEDIPTWEDLSRKFTDQYRYCAETPPTLLELSTKEMAQGQRFEEYATKWRAQAAKHIPPISEVQQIQLFHSTLRGVYYSHLLAHTSSFSDLIEAGKKLDLGIKLGMMEGPVSKGEESSKKVPATSSSSSGRRGKEVSVNAVNTAQQASQQYSMNFTAVPPAAPSYAPHAPQYRPQPPTQPIYYSALPPPPPSTEMIDAKELVFNAIRSSNVQANPLPDHGPAQGPSINMITVCTSREGEGERGEPSPFVIEYVPTKATGPLDLRGRCRNLEQQFGVMYITRSGRLYENPATTDKGKAPATEAETIPRAPSVPPKKVTEEEAEAFMKVIKASEYKVVEQMAKSPAHISLLALLLNSKPPREALLRVLTAAQTISVIRDYGEVGPSRANRMIGKVLLRHNYIPGTGLGARGQGISRPIEVEEYKHKRGLGFRPSCHEIIEARQGNHLHRLATRYGRLNRGIPVPPLSYFFPGPPLIIGSTSDDPSSDFDDTTDALPIVYAVTEEIPSVVHIRPAQENEELNNWTSVLRYSAVIADINVGTEEEPRVLKIGTSLDPTQRVRMINFETKYQEVFAWSYADMLGLDPSIVKHFLPLDTEKFPPKRQQLRRQRASLLLRIKEEVVKQINAGFLERAMVTLFHDMTHKEVEVYVDDMIAKSKEGEDHLVNLKRLFDRLKEYKLRLNPAKCTFGARSGKLLGFVVNERGIEVDPDKVKAIKELPPPSSVREVRGFLGRLNYIARFIANLTDKCQLLFRLLRKNAAIEWDEECQKAFDTIKAQRGLEEPGVGSDRSNGFGRTDRFSLHPMDRSSSRVISKPVSCAQSKSAFHIGRIRSVTVNQG
ncbi:hypothetical protein CRG98_030791 [Punica granatum]|uniref:G-patch domain-containing protein n=1 Tax=Punica granatum TaxID=22663 RepID=A0A2I0IXU7_PUNGR|nr:hypothetical protein CRG98_030791 [Punica granatum]